MRKLSVFCATAAFSCACFAPAADWLSYGADAQMTFWQPREKAFGPGTVKDIKLLWNQQLESQPGGLNALTPPLILGPIITHRGIKELVFVAGAGNNIYAVDADLGRVFWKRHLEVAPTPVPNQAWPCGAGLTATPVIAPEAPRPGTQAPVEDDGEAHTPARPLYVLTSDGRLHRLRPADGVESGQPLAFVPPGAKASHLNLAGDFLYTTTSGKCEGSSDGVWSIATQQPDAHASFFAATKAQPVPDSSVSVSAKGTVYAGFRQDRGGFVLALTPGTLKANSRLTLPGAENSVGPAASPVTFVWKGRELTAVADGSGGLFLLNAKPVKAKESGTAHAGFRGNLTTWEDPAGTRWIYAATGSNIIAFRLGGTATLPEPERIWTSGEMAAPGSPVIANGVLFALGTGQFSGGAKTPEERAAQSTHATLYALDAATGRELYSSGDAVKSFAHSGGLAVANGHACFATWDNTLYCFGFPIEI